MSPALLSGLSPLLFAQQATADAAFYGGPPVAAMVFLATLVLAIPLAAIILGVRQAQRERELEHAERMKALEMGRTLPRDLPTVFWTPGKLAAGMGIVLPLVSFLFAMILSLNEVEVAYSAWVASCFVGICGVIGATVLTLRFGHPATHTGAAGDTAAKPTVDDPDLYDTAGQRGWSHGSGPGALAARP